MNKVFDWLIKIFIVVAPTLYVSGIKIRVAQMIFFILFTVVLFGVSMCCKPKRPFNNLWAGLFIILNVLTVCIYDPQKIPLAFFNVALGCLLYYLIVTYVDDIRGICKAFVVVMLINLPLVVVQLFGYDPVLIPAHGATPVQTIYGFFAFSNHLGLYMAIITPIVLYFSWFWLPIIAFLTVVPRCLTGSIVFMLSSYTLLLRGSHSVKYTMACIVIGVIVLVAILFSPQMGKVFLKTGSLTPSRIHNKMEGRLLVWDKTFREIMTNPYFGRGLDKFNIESQFFTKEVSDKIWDTPQNDYLHLSYELGFIPMAILLIGYISNLIRKFWGARYDKLTLALFLSICSILVCMIPQYFLYVPRLITLIIFILALFEARAYDITEGGELC